MLTVKGVDCSELEKADELPRAIADHITGPVLANTSISLGTISRVLYYVTNEFPDSNFTSVSDLERRVQMVDGSFIESRICTSLRRLGIQSPEDVVMRCPALVRLGLPMVAGADDREITQLEHALSNIAAKFSKKDLKSLVKNRPVVLTYSTDYFNELYHYLRHEIRLDTGEEIALARRHAHEMRHFLNIRLATTIAWCLPISRLKARHQLALFLDCWPPVGRTEPDGSAISETVVFERLLTARNDQLGLTLGLEHPNKPGVSQLSARDVQVFHAFMDREAGEAGTDEEEAATK